jgi:hypothetical protein
MPDTKYKLWRKTPEAGKPWVVVHESASSWSVLAAYIDHCSRDTNYGESNRYRLLAEGESPE